MKLQFTPDLEAKLARCAVEQNLDPAQVVAQLVAHYFEEEDRFVAAVQLGEAAFSRGDYLTHEQAGERLSRFLAP
jgi:predicted transcriptional regulator